MHWTYEKECPPKDAALRQGDILERTDELLTLFNEVHPHFCDEKYRGFLVLTQTCDLVKREQGCSATHITLSVIRSMQDLISDVLRSRFGYLAPGVYVEGKKKYVEQLIERIINQNEQALGLFYLHPDADVGIPVHSVSILRVSIAVRAEEHYNTLANARIGRLEQLFQSRLGWMVGNLYSRVAVRDWKDEAVANEIALMKDLLCFGNRAPIWIGKKTREKCKKAGINIEELSPSDIEGMISRLREPEAKEKVIKRVMELIKNNLPKMPPEKLEKFETHLSNDQKLDAFMKRFEEDEQFESMSCSDLIEPAINFILTI
ncbi:MAG: hypothetical protein ABR911_01610 [Syntrophales bacterium]